MRRLLLAAVAALGAAHAQAQDALSQRALAATCAQCHGTDGHSAAPAAIPSLAGMPREQMVAKLKAFQSGTLPSTVMGQLARGFDDAQIAQLAAYFAARR